MVDQVLQAQFGAGVESDERGGDLSEPFVRCADDGDLVDGGEIEEAIRTVLGA